jgi:hypothetical protein
MAILSPVITQTTSGSVTITCTGAKNTYIMSSLSRDRVGTIKGSGGDTSAIGDTVARAVGDTLYASGVPYQNAIPARLPRQRPFIGATNRVRIGDSVTTISVLVGSGIKVSAFSPNGSPSHSSDVSGVPGTGQWYIVW